MNERRCKRRKKVGGSEMKETRKKVEEREKKETGGTYEFLLFVRDFVVHCEDLGRAVALEGGRYTTFVDIRTVICHIASERRAHRKVGEQRSHNKQTTLQIYALERVDEL